MIMENAPRTKVLLVEDNPGDADLIGELLYGSSTMQVDLTRFSRLKDSLDFLTNERVHVVLLDLSLPDSSGIETCVAMLQKVPDVPIIILTGMDDQDFAIDAVQKGAQDYLVKGELDSNGLGRSVRYAIERGRVAEQLRQAQKMEAIGRLAGGVAHDFNNLLTVILGHSELGLMKANGDEVFSEHFNEIRQAGEIATSLTRKLLAFSRKEVVRTELLDLNEVISSLSKMLRRLIGEDIELRFFPDPGIEPLMADVGHIEQILMNLAVNARDAMPEGGVLAISTDLVDSEVEMARPLPGAVSGRFTRIIVSDTGVGIHTEVLGRIFEPFFTTKPIGKGTGLGLATVQSIVEQNSGILRVESQVGVGTTFQIYLPCTAGRRLATRPSGRAEDAEESWHGEENILLVEDDSMVRAMARKILERYGYTVWAAESAEEAIVLFVDRQHTIDLLLTDVIMPGLNGGELVERLRGVDADLKVVLMSGYADQVLTDKDMRVLEVDFIQKPFSPPDLARRIRICLDR